MIQPAELKSTRPIELHEGVISTTTDVWSMLTASRNGDLDRVKELVQRCRALLTCQYDYTAPLHLAVREGHLDLVRYLVEQGALDPTYKNHPFSESLGLDVGLLRPDDNLERLTAPIKTKNPWRWYLVEPRIEDPASELNYQLWKRSIWRPHGISGFRKLRSALAERANFVGWFLCSCRRR